MLYPGNPIIGIVILYFQVRDLTGTLCRNQHSRSLNPLGSKSGDFYVKHWVAHGTYERNYSSSPDKAVSEEQKT